jgi:NodT family efflux transporter outer membrane factor (OMF) lipoprotein
MTGTRKTGPRMTRSQLLRAAAAGLLVLLGGCNTFRTTYVRPDAAIQPQWAHATAADQAPQADAWWRRFDDPNLDRLVDRVLVRDNDLAVAAVNLRRARLQARFAVINPTISANDTLSYTVPLKGQLPSTQINTGTLMASYEVDLFGALAAQKDVARWEANATAQDLASTRLSLIGTAVDDYYQIAYLNERIDLAGQSVAYAQKTLDLVQLQARAGGASSLEVAESVQSLSSQQATLKTLTQQLVEARAALNLLLNGETADEADEPKVLPQGDPPSVDAGLPSALLARRPDLRAVEARLREKLADVDQTRLSFYPKISLTGSLGSTDNSLSQLLRNPAGTLGADLVLPFLQLDQLKLNVGVSRADYDAAAIQFRQTLYQALTDVENALSARTQYAAATADLETSLKNAQLVERLDEVRYRAGAIPLKTWLDAQETRRQTEVSLAQNRLSQFQTYVSLCKALGGDAVRPDKG